MSSYFNTSFDILTNLDEERELNHDGVKPINTVLFNWAKVFPEPISPDKPTGSISCAPAAATAPSAAAEKNKQCFFFEHKHTPGFWDTVLPGRLRLHAAPGGGQEGVRRGGARVCISWATAACSACTCTRAGASAAARPTP